MIQVEGTEKCRGSPKTTLVEIVKKDMSTNEVLILLKIHTRPQKIWNYDCFVVVVLQEWRLWYLERRNLLCHATRNSFLPAIFGWNIKFPSSSSRKGVTSYFAKLTWPLPLQVQIYIPPSHVSCRLSGFQYKHSRKYRLPWNGGYLGLIGLRNLF